MKKLTGQRIHESFVKVAPEELDTEKWEEITEKARDLYNAIAQDLQQCDCARCAISTQHTCHASGCDVLLLDDEECPHCHVRFCSDHVGIHMDGCNA